MNSSGAASISGALMTATEVREKEKKAIEMIEMNSQRMVRAWQQELIANSRRSGSLDSHVRCETDMKIIERITNDRHKLLGLFLSPKHLYLGRQQFHALRSTQEFGHAMHDRTADGQVQFMGFDLYEVTVDEHYVMTGE